MVTGVAARQRAVQRGGHQQLHAQRVDHRHAHHRALLDALAEVDIAFDDDAVEGAAHRAQRQLGLGHAALLDPDALLAARLGELLGRHLGLAARLFERLLGDEVLRHQRLGAFDLLLRQLQAGLGGAHVGIDGGARAGHAGVGAFDFGAQRDQCLAGADAVAAFDLEPFDQADHLRADVGDAVGFDQAAQRFGRGPGGMCGQPGGCAAAQQQAQLDGPAKASRRSHCRSCSSRLRRAAARRRSSRCWAQRRCSGASQGEGADEGGSVHGVISATGAAV